MDTKQIDAALDRTSYDEGARIDFWNDPEREFQAIQAFSPIDGMKVNFGKFAPLLAEVKAVTGGGGDD